MKKNSMIGLAMAAILLMLHTSSQAQPDPITCCEKQCIADYLTESGGCSGDAYVTATCIASSSEAAAVCIDGCPTDPACATQCFADYAKWSGRCSGNSSQTADCLKSSAEDAEDCVRTICPATSACAAQCLAEYFASSGGCPDDALETGKCIASSSRTALDCVNPCTTTSACARRRGET